MSATDNDDVKILSKQHGESPGKVESEF